MASSPSPRLSRSMARSAARSSVFLDVGLTSVPLLVPVSLVP